MKVKEGFLLSQVKDQHVVIAVGEASKQFNGFIRLNEPAVRLWKELEEEKNSDQLANVLIRTYGIDEERARADVDSFLAMLKQNEFLYD